MDYEIKQIDPTDIPEDMRVHCPLTDGMLRKMKRCFDTVNPDGSTGCEHCKGVIEPNPDDLRWPVRYRLICAHPVARNIHPVAED